MHMLPADAAFAAAVDHALQHLSIATPFPRWMLVREVDPDHPRQVVAALDPTGEIHRGQALDGSMTILAPAEVRLDVAHPDGSPFGALIGDGASPGTTLDRAGRELASLIAHLVGALAAASLDRRGASTGARPSSGQGSARTIDDLTGLVTRKEWEARLQQEEAVCAQFGEAAAVIVIELDELKHTNSESGHAAGDTDLRTAGEIVRSVVSTRGLAARLTGDRLSIALVGASGADARTMDGEILAALATAGISAVSAGARRHPERGLFGAVADAMAALDRRHAETSPRREISPEQIDDALTSGALTAYFQPIIGLLDGKIEALRAVPRWHTESTILEPEDFLLSVRFAHRAGAMFRRLADAGLHLAATFRPTFPDLQVLVGLEIDGDDAQPILDIPHLADTHGLEPNSLAIGISERQVHSIPGTVRDALVAVAAQGVTLVLTEHEPETSARESVLATLPFSVLSLHHRLTGLLAESGPGSSSVRDTIAAALRSGAMVLAEGVDTQVQRDRLMRLGVTFGYGYLFALPQPAEAMSTMLQPLLSPRP